MIAEVGRTYNALRLDATNRSTSARSLAKSVERSGRENKSARCSGSPGRTPVAFSTASGELRRMRGGERDRRHSGLAVSHRGSKTDGGVWIDQHLGLAVHTTHGRDRLII